MKKLIIPFFVSIFCFFGGITVVAAEEIDQFQANYTVQANGEVRVVETITYDFGSADRRGIFRTIEKVHPQPASAWYKERYIDLAVVAVTRNGKIVPYEITDDRTSVKIQIGDANQTISGLHEYKISYNLIGVLSVYDDQTEFYWNVTGNQWTVPIKQVSATVLGAVPGLLDEASACYQGVPESTVTCSEVNKTSVMREFSANHLAPGEELTIATAVSSDVVLSFAERWSPVLVLLGALVVWSLGVAFWIWRYRTQDNPRHPVVPQYEPYDEYLPMYTGVLFDGRLHPRDITGGIVYLAEQGFIEIERTKKPVWWLFSITDYEITLQKPVKDVPTRFLRDVMELLFSVRTKVPQTVRLSQLKQRQRKNRVVITKLQKKLQHDLEAVGFMTRTVTGTEVFCLLITGIILICAAWWWKVELIMFVAIVITLASAIIVYVPRRTKKGYEALLHIKGFREFLRITDSERFTFHNAPKKNPKIFMQYLPYAIALGVEKEWSQVFSGITMPTPDWYKDTTRSTFSSQALTNDINTFSTAFITATGSSGSSRSGSSGGGSAGGGAGGGGGGSW